MKLKTKCIAAMHVGLGRRGWCAQTGRRVASATE